MQNQNYKELVCQLKNLLSDFEVQERIQPELQRRALALLKIGNNKPELKKSTKVLGGPLQSLNRSNSSQKIIPKLTLNQSKENIPKRTVVQGSRKVPLQTRSKSRTKLNFISKTEPSQSAIHEISPKRGEFLEIIELIEIKQQEVQEQRSYLQSKINELKHLIEEERFKLSQVNQEISLASIEVSKLTQNSQQSHSTFHVSRKKLESIFSQVKTLNESYQSTKTQNQEVLGSLEEERQLVRMYRAVIEELKSQTKIEKEAYDDIKKKLALIKKTEHVAKVKYTSMNDSSASVIENLKDSISKWI